MTYVPAALYLALAIVFVAGGLVSSAILGGRPGRPSRVDLQPYECGVGSLDSPRQGLRVRFYLTAILFILFDLEAVYLYPWAALFRDLKLFGLIEMGVFLGILVIGYVYAWKRGALEWD